MVLRIEWGLIVASEPIGVVDISIVSHGHGQMVVDLVHQLLSMPEVERVLVTINTPEDLALDSHHRLTIIHNVAPKGFGANHNAAFLHSVSPFFCVLNPDVVFKANVFPALMKAFEASDASMVVPLVVNASGQVEDSLRRFITPWRMVKRLFKLSSGAYSVALKTAPFYPEWAAGMFMLFRRVSFERLSGFDPRYFMYCEDADICTRLWASGGKLVAVPDALVMHDAQRDSRRRLRYLGWHLASMIKYIMKFMGRLPRVPGRMQ